MTVQNSTYRADYTGNGVTTAFTVPFYFLDPTHLEVILTNTTTNLSTYPVLNSDYTVTGAGVTAGGTVTFPVAPATDIRASIVRSVPYTQLTHFVPNDPLPAASLEATLDVLTMQNQQQQEQLDRSIVLPIGTIAPGIAPVPVSGSVLGWVSGAWAWVSGAAVSLAANLLDTSSVALGDALVGVKQPLTGAVATTQHRKNLEIVSILDFGGVSDGVTDCAAAINSAGAAVGGVGVVRFPFIAGTANVYWFSSFNAAYWPTITFDVDPGVVLNTPYDDINQVVGAGLGFMRPTTFYWRSQLRYMTVGESHQVAGAKPFPNKQLWVSQGDFDRSVYTPVICNSGVVSPLSIPWPSSDTWSADTFTASAAKTFSKTVAAVDSAMHLGMIKVIPGQEIDASIAVTAGSPTLCAIIRHSNGFCGLQCSSDGTATGVAIVNKVLTVTGTTTNQFPAWKGTHASYAPVNSTWAIRIDGWNRASILINGWVVASFTTTGAIFQAGFGLFAQANGDAITVENMVTVTNKPQTYGTGLSVRVFGDSRTAPRHDCWVDHLREALDMTAGIRMVKVDNQAISGATSGGQWTAMQAVGVSDVDLVIIDIGTNDVQSALGVSNLLTNLQNMITYTLAVGKQCLIVNFDLWYTQGQAGASGQASLYYDQGRPYRTAILRAGADNAVKVLDSPAISGPVLANYVNASLTPNWTLQGDPYVVDNIHPTTTANRMRAWAVAQAVCGMLMPQPGLKLGATALTGPKNGWAISIQAPYATIDASGTITFDGLINNPGGATAADGTTLITLPQHLWPSRTKRFKVYGSIPSEPTWLLVDQNTGNIQLYGLTSSTYVSLDSLTWGLI